MIARVFPGTELTTTVGAGTAGLPASGISRQWRCFESRAGDDPRRGRVAPGRAAGDPRPDQSGTLAVPQRPCRRRRPAPPARASARPRVRVVLSGPAITVTPTPSAPPRDGALRPSPHRPVRVVGVLHQRTRDRSEPLCGSWSNSRTLRLEFHQAGDDQPEGRKAPSTLCSPPARWRRSGPVGKHRSPPPIGRRSIRGEPIRRVIGAHPSAPRARLSTQRVISACGCRAMRFRRRFGSRAASLT